MASSSGDHSRRRRSHQKKKSGFRTKLSYEMAVARNDRRGTVTMALITVALLTLVWFLATGAWPIMDGHAVCGHALSLILGWEVPGGASNSETALLRACTANARTVMQWPTIALVAALALLGLWLLFGAKKKRKKRRHRSSSGHRSSSSSRSSRSSSSSSRSRSASRPVDATPGAHEPTPESPLSADDQTKDAVEA